MSEVIRSDARTWSASDWDAEVASATGLLHGAGTRVLASLLDNGPAFIALDEAALQARLVHLPLPPFFTPGQLHHALAAAGADTLIASPALAGAWPRLQWSRTELAGQPLAIAQLDLPPQAMPAGTAKITFTSGTTGQPKGVCLGAEAMQYVVEGLVQTLGPLGIERHLSVLPYSVLLENLAGTLAARRQGATVVSLPLNRVGLSGSSRFDAAAFDRALREHEAHSVILLPQMLRAWVGHLVATGQRAAPSLRFVAVGGAAVGAAVLHQSHALGIPACEGYGLSEACSVQTLNLPSAHRTGSAGQPLPHAKLRVSATGEIEVQGSLFLGYLGDQRPPPAWWPTGDLGRIDTDGYLHIEGRRKHVLITAFGRNVSPEWVETALCSQPEIATAVVCGDGQPALDAVIWPSPLAGPVPDDALAAAVARANAGLPDYARIARWVRADLAHDTADGLFTQNGRPVRDRVQARHGPRLAGAAADPVTAP